MIKCELIIGGYSYKITDDVMNWDDVTISLKRGNYDGVVRSFSSKFEFVNMAYALLKKQYQDNYLGAAASIVISRRNNSWTWNELFRCTLDFSTYTDDGRIISINAVDNTLAAIIKAKKGSQYEYLVSDLYTDRLKYDRLMMQNCVNWHAVGEYSNDNSEVKIQFQGRNYESIPMYHGVGEIFANKKIKYNDVEIGGVQVYSGFVQAIEPVDVKVKIKISYITDTSQSDNTRIILFKNGVIYNNHKWNNNSSSYTDIDVEIPVKLSRIGTSNSFDSLSIGIFSSKQNYNAVFKDFKVSCYWCEREDSEEINTIPLNIVLNKLLESMTGENSPYSAVISDYIPDLGIGRLNNTRIMAAESIRGIPNAKLYTSFNKFCDWMEAEFGYVYTIEEKIIRFIHRDELFSDSVIKDIGKNVNGFQYSVNSSLIYSSVKVGYDKQDYDSINGRDEFRFTNEFSTGINLTDNTLSLISPYRADAYGIEFLVKKRGKDTTDNESDNDVFFVAVVPVRNPSTNKIDIILDRPYLPKELSGLISPESMFNLQYSPRFMLEANKSYIGACTKLLKFTSSNGNSDVSINGVKETNDMTIESPLFTIGEVEIETSDLDVPDDLMGLVTLNNNDEIISGYIKQLKINAGREESAKYSLIVKDIKKMIVSCV